MYLHRTVIENTHQKSQRIRQDYTYMCIFKDRHVQETDNMKRLRGPLHLFNSIYRFERHFKYHDARVYLSISQ